MPVMTLLWMKVVDCFLFSYLQLEMLVIHGSEQYLTLCASHSMPFFFFRFFLKDYAIAKASLSYQEILALNYWLLSV